MELTPDFFSDTLAPCKSPSKTIWSKTRTSIPSPKTRPGWRSPWASFAQERLTLAQGARFAGLDFLAFQRELALREIPIHYGPKEFAEDLADLDSEAL